ncbi:MAG: hypothetical protein QM796_16625 [Chthoniobacteraceae bacterium]
MSLLDTRDADFKKFVEIRTEDAQKLHALDERLGGILGLFEHAAIEFQPAQLAVEKVLGCVKNGSHARCHHKSWLQHEQIVACDNHATHHDREK